MTRPARVLLWAAGAICGVLALAVLWFAAMMSGGFDDLLSGEGPKATDKKVVAALDKAHTVNRQELDDLLQHARFLQAGPDATAAAQRCETGQHNWKTDDAYDLSCTVTDAVLVTAGTAALHDQMLALDASLTSDPRWAGQQSMPLSRVVREYWDARGRFPAGYTPASLPTARYDDRASGSSLQLRWVVAGGRLDLGSFADQVSWRDPNGIAMTAQEVSRLVPGGDRYGLVVELSRIGFED